MFQPPPSGFSRKFKVDEEKFHVPSENPFPCRAYPKMYIYFWRGTGVSGLSRWGFSLVARALENPVLSLEPLEPTIYLATFLIEHFSQGTTNIVNSQGWHHLSAECKDIDPGCC